MKTKLKILSFFFAVAGIMTVLPLNLVSESSALGYKAFCPFSPFSTVLLFFLALTSYRYIPDLRD